MPLSQLRKMKIAALFTGTVNIYQYFGISSGLDNSFIVYIETACATSEILEDSIGRFFPKNCLLKITSPKNIGTEVTRNTVQISNTEIFRK